MNTKLLMTITSVSLALVGVFLLFTPDVLLSALDITVTPQASLLAQMLGALYFSFALMNWTAKDSAIGGIYARPVSLANFGHFFSGALLLIKFLFSNPFNLPTLLVALFYAVFAIIFYWLVFRATGLKPQ